MGKGRAGRGAIFDHLLGTWVVGMATLPMAGDSTEMQVSITFAAADHLVLVPFLGQLVEGRFDDSTPEVKHQEQGELFLNILV